MDANAGDELLERVRGMSLAGTGSRRAIAQLVLGEGSGLGRLSMAEVAQLSYCSKPSLVRFAQSLGFGGWPAFQEAFSHAASAEEARAEVDCNFPFDEGTGVTEVVTRVAEVERHAIDQVVEALDEDALERAAGLVCAARQVVCFGVEQNRYFEQNFAHRLRQIGIECLVPSLATSALVARGMGEDCCAILVSYSGLGAQRLPAVLLDDLRRGGVPTIAVTSSGENLLSRACDCTLEFPPEERLYSKIAGYYSERATGLVLDLLFSLCFQAAYEKNVRRKLDAVVRYERLMQTTDVLSS